MNYKLIKNFKQTGKLLSTAFGVSACLLFSQFNVMASDLQKVTIEIPTELKILSVNTNATTLEQLFSEIGVVLSEKDTTSVPLSESVKNIDTVKVYRGFNFKVTIDEEVVIESASIGTTVGDLINELSSTYEKQFYSNNVYSDVLSENSQLVLVSDTTLLEDGQINFFQDETIQFATVEVEDDTIPLGEKFVMTKGETGVKRIIYSAEILEGDVISKTPTSIELVSMPVEEVVGIGTGTVSSIDEEKWQQILEERQDKLEKAELLAVLEEKENEIKTENSSENTSGNTSEDSLDNSEIVDNLITNSENSQLIVTSGNVISTHNSSLQTTEIFQEVTKDENGNVLTILGYDVDIAESHDMNATAYTCNGYTGYTASGTIAKVGVVAVDPEFIPLGTKLYIEGYGYAIAEDTGAAIQENKIDLYFNSEEECYQFGVREVVVHILAE